jgi:hypothetical protein
VKCTMGALHPDAAAVDAADDDDDDDDVIVGVALDTWVGQKMLKVSEKIWHVDFLNDKCSARDQNGLFEVLYVDDLTMSILLRIKSNWDTTVTVLLLEVLPFVRYIKGMELRSSVCHLLQWRQAATTNGSIAYIITSRS